MHQLFIATECSFILGLGPKHRKDSSVHTIKLYEHIIKKAFVLGEAFFIICHAIVFQVFLDFAALRCVFVSFGIILHMLLWLYTVAVAE